MQRKQHLPISLPALSRRTHFIKPPGKPHHQGNSSKNDNLVTRINILIPSLLNLQQRLPILKQQMKHPSPNLPHQHLIVDPPHSRNKRLQQHFQNLLFKR
ncbi:hypothetical protein PHAVU_003G137532 [Phaseolus vulgaris]